MAEREEARERLTGGGWTHDRVIGEYQQYFFKRFLKLDSELLQSMVEEKIITKKIKTAVVASNCDMDYFLAIVKKKKVKKFVKFLEVLERTFSWNENHRTLVSTISEHLVLMTDVEPEDKETITRVIWNAQKQETSPEEIISQQTELLVEGQTKTESEPQVAGETKLTTQPTSPMGVAEFGDLLQPSSLPPQTTGQSGSAGVSKEVLVTSAGSTSDAVDDRAEPVTQTVETVEHTAVKMMGLSVADDARVPPPRGYIEPRHAEIFSRERLVNDTWTFYSVEHGVTISIHKDAVPPNMDTFGVCMHAYLWGPFEIPEEYEICTAIFVIQMHPKFEFCKPVMLKIPHSVIFEDDDEPEDFVVLRAPEPAFSDAGTHIPKLSGACSVIPPDTHIPSDTQSSDSERHTASQIPSVYKFSDVISDADYSEDYYVQVDLDHFSAVAGAKRRRRYRLRKSTLSLSLNRQGSLSKQRRSKRNLIKKSIMKAQRGDSIGSNHSSRESSYDGSFERREMFLERQQSPLVRQCSSAESDGPYTKHLHRQRAITRDDDCSLTPIYVQRQSSSIEDMSCNEICITCCNPVQCTTNWTTRFMVAPNTPTGTLALDEAAREFSEKQCCEDMEYKEQIAFPSSHYISLEPAEWESSDWMASATTTPQIHLSLVRKRESGHHRRRLPHIDFDVRRTSQCCSTTLHQEITVTGAEANHKRIYFTIKSAAERRVKRQSDVIYTESWLYPEDSQILQALNNADCDIDLYPCADHCRLMADIAFQLPNRVYERLLNEFGISEAVCDQLEAGEKYNLPECVYKALHFYVSDSERKPTLNGLKSILAKVGFRDIKLCCSDIPLLSDSPELYDKECDCELLVGLAERKLGVQWRFVGCYFGLTNVDIDDLLSQADRDGRKDAASRLLLEWKQQNYGRAASVAALVKALYRIKQLNSSFVGELWRWLQNKIKEIQQNDDYYGIPVVSHSLSKCCT
jgi:hypothetical protein